MSAPINLLILAYSFPPDTEVGALRLGRFARYLPEYGIRPIVLSVDERHYRGLDTTFRLPGEVRVERTPVLPNPSNWYKPIKRMLPFAGRAHDRKQFSDARREEKQGVGWRDHVKSAFEFPDQDWGWYWPALKRASEILRKEKIDAILSTSPPAIDHVIGLKLKERFGLPWILDFRDPWTENLLAGDRPEWYTRFSLRLERQCVLASNLVVCNTDHIRRAFERQYPELSHDRFVTITNGFEAVEPPPTIPKTERSPVEILHLGSLYSGRRIDGLGKAVAELYKNGESVPGAIRFSFLGTVDPCIRELVEKSTPELLQDGTIRFEDRVEFAEAQRRMWGADILVLVQGGHTLQIPAKFYEYLPTGKPMLAISEPGALTDILNETGSGAWAAPDDIDAIKAALFQVLRMPQKSPAEVSTRFGRFEYRTLTETLASCVGTVVGSPQLSSLTI